MSGTVRGSPRLRPRPTQGVRAVRAAIVIAAIVFAPVAVDRVLESPAASTARAAAALVEAEELADGTAADTALPGSDELSLFESELFSLEGFADVRATEGAGVVGFSMAADAAQAYRSVADRIVAAGWTEVPSGAAAAGSFVKEGGRLRWAFVSCTAVGDAASVVVHCA